MSVEEFQPTRNAFVITRTDEKSPITPPEMPPMIGEVYPTLSEANTAILQFLKQESTSHTSTNSSSTNSSSANSSFTNSSSTNSSRTNSDSGFDSLGSSTSNINNQNCEIEGCKSMMSHDGRWVCHCKDVKLEVRKVAFRQLGVCQTWCFADEKAKWARPKGQRLGSYAK